MGNKNNSKKDVWLADPGYAGCPGYALVISHVGYKVTYWSRERKKEREMMLPLDRVRDKIDSIEERGGALDKISRIDSGSVLVRVYDPYGKSVLREQLISRQNDEELRKVCFELIRSVNLERHYSYYQKASAKK